jgi:hypothetical protein
LLVLWKLESDENFFRIYDSKKLVAGYFDPDYGDIFPKSNSEEIIASMLKNHDKILGGAVMVPFVKFGLFDSDLDTTLTKVEEQVFQVNGRLQKWKNFLSETNRQDHSIRISHTDQDMLTITFQLRFSKPTPLDKMSLSEEIIPILNVLQKTNLL